MTSRINVDTIAATSADQVIVDDALTVNETLSVVGALSAGSIAITGDLPVSDGGTGASTAADARTNLGLGTIATQSAASVSITGGSITGITDLAVADGGTGSSTAGGALTNLGVSSFVQTMLNDATAGEVIATIGTSAAGKTVPVGGDYLMLLDSADSFLGKVATIQQFFTSINGLTGEATPAVADILPVYDASASAARGMALENMLKVVNGLTEDTTPDTDDFLLSYDVSASAAKKVKPENLSVAARKNAIINGGFDIFQRATSYASIGNTQYLADRWRYNLGGTTAVHAASRSTDVPSVALAGRLFNYSHLLDCTTADGTLGAADFISLEQRIEGYNWLPLAQRACTLSFLVKATKTGTYCVSFRNTGNDQCYIAEYTVSVSDTWEKKTIQLPASPSSGTWDYTNGEGLKLAFILAAGTDHHGTAGAWSGSNKIATANQVNAVDDVANNFRITGVQLEVGSVASDFEYRTQQDELTLCERYFEKTYDFATAIGTATVTGAERWIAARTAAVDFATSVFRTRKRATPTITIYSTGTGTAGQIRNESTAADVAGTSADVGETRFRAGASITDTNVYGWHWTADAEI